MSDVSAPAAATREIDEQEFQTLVVERGGLSVVDFSAPWCGPCRMLEPILGELATEHAGSVEFWKVDVDRSPTLAIRYGVQAAPTLLFLRSGRVVDRVVGLRAKAFLAERLDALRAG